MHLLRDGVLAEEDFVTASLATPNAVGV